MDALTWARTLAVANTVADAAVVWAGQRSYDLPHRRRRLGVQCAAGAGYLGVLLAGDALWAAATRHLSQEQEQERAAPEPVAHEPAAHLPGTSPALPAYEVTLALRLCTTSLAWSALWWAGRTVPDRMRRRGVARPNRLLAPPLALAFAATTAPTWWAHARDRAAAAGL